MSKILTITSALVELCTVLMNLQLPVTLFLLSSLPGNPNVTNLTDESMDSLLSVWKIETEQGRIFRSVFHWDGLLKYTVYWLTIILLLSFMKFSIVFVLSQKTTNIASGTSTNWISKCKVFYINFIKLISCKSCVTSFLIKIQEYYKNASAISCMLYDRKQLDCFGCHLRWLWHLLKTYAEPDGSESHP